MTRHETISAGSDAAGPDKKSGADSPSAEKKSEKEIPIKYDFQKGQVWIAPESDFRLEIKEKTKGGLFRISLKGEEQLYGTKLEESKKNLERLIRQGGYQLVLDESHASDSVAVVEEGTALRKGIVEDGGESTPDNENEEGAVSIVSLTDGELKGKDDRVNGGEKPVKFKSLVDAMQVIQNDLGISASVEKKTSENVDASVDAEPSKRRENPILNEFNLLEDTIEKIINDTTKPISLGIKRILEENRAVLGEQFVIFVEKQEEIATAVNKINREDEVLSDTIEQSNKIIAEQLDKKKDLKNQLEVLCEELLALEREVKASIEAAKNGTAELVPEQKHLNAGEEKIGEEKYEDLCALVSDAWQGLQASLGGSTVLKIDHNRVWRTTLLPLLKEEIKNFLQAYTELREDEYEAVIGTLITKQGLPVKRRVFGKIDPERQKNMKQ